MKKWFPLILTVVMASWFFGTLRPPKETDFAYAEFGRIPVVFNGRIQPMDSLARNTLLQLREKQTANLEPKRLERKAKNHSGDRMAGQCDDEARNGRCLACFPG